MSNVDAAIAAVETPERAVNARIALPSGHTAVVALPLAATDTDLLTIILALPNLLAQARAQVGARPIILARAPMAKQ